MCVTNQQNWAWITSIFYWMPSDFQVNSWPLFQFIRRIFEHLSMLVISDIFIKWGPENIIACQWMEGHVKINLQCIIALLRSSNQNLSSFTPSHCIEPPFHVPFLPTNRKAWEKPLIFRKFDSTQSESNARH